MGGLLAALFYPNVRLEAGLPSKYRSPCYRR